MKKIIAILAVASAAVGMSLSAAAQGTAAKGFGIVGGFTSSSSNAKNFDKSSVSQYLFGITYKLPLVSGFAIQPGLIYHVKGANLEDADKNHVSAYDFVSSFQTKTGYLEVPVQIQWGPDLLAFRPYAFAEPFVGYQVTKDEDVKGVTVSEDELNSYLNDHKRKLEYGLGLGLGLEFSRLQISAKYFWNFGSLYTAPDQSTGSAVNAAGSTIRNAFKDGKNFNGIDVSLAIFF